MSEYKTAYAASRARLEERKLRDTFIKNRINELCNLIGMAHAAARKQAEMELNDETL